jgi:hypothetical protein
VGDLAVEPALVKNGKKPQPPSPDIPLEVVFDDGAGGILSDGLGAYVHGTDFVSAVIRSNGMLYFQAFDGKRKDPVLRGVTVNLSSTEEVWSQTDLDDFVDDVEAVERVGNPDYDFWPDATFTSDVTLHTRNAEGGMYTMEENSILVDGGKIGFNEYGNGDSWEWRLLFDTRVDGVADDLGLCITHPDADSWLVTAEPGACDGAVDDVTELWRVQRGVFTHVADFHTAMRLSVTWDK